MFATNIKRMIEIHISIIILVKHKITKILYIIIIKRDMNCKNQSFSF